MGEAQEDTCAHRSILLMPETTVPADTWRIPRGQTPFTPESPAGQEPMTELLYSMGLT